MAGDAKIAGPSPIHLLERVGELRGRIARARDLPLLSRAREVERAAGVAADILGALVDGYTDLSARVAALEEGKR